MKTNFKNQFLKKAMADFEFAFAKLVEITKIQQIAAEVLEGEAEGEQMKKEIEICERMIDNIQRVFKSPLGKLHYLENSDTCPYCGSDKTETDDTNYEDDGVYRQKECKECGGRFEVREELVYAGTEQIEKGNKENGNNG